MLYVNIQHLHAHHGDQGQALPKRHASRHSLSGHHHHRQRPGPDVYQTSWCHQRGVHQLRSATTDRSGVTYQPSWCHQPGVHTSRSPPATTVLHTSPACHQPRSATTRPSLPFLVSYQPKPARRYGLHQATFLGRSWSHTSQSPPATSSPSVVAIHQTTFRTCYYELLAVLGLIPAEARPRRRHLV